MTSKKATAQGLGVPLPPSRRSATEPPPSPPKLTEADEADDSITATAPGLAAAAAVAAAAIVPTSARIGPVKISELAEDEGDETEVRTVVASFAGIQPGRRPAPAPAAGRPPAAAPPVPDAGFDAIDDSVTAQAPSIVLPADDEPSTQPPVLSPAALPMGGRLRASSVDTYAGGESVTSRAAALPPYDDDDESVTEEGPAVGSPSTSMPGGRSARDERLPASVRGDGPVRLGASEEEDDPHDHTAVMINAPVKPVDRAPLFTTTPMNASPGIAGAAGAGRTLLAPAHDPSSDSGLRIAPAVGAEPSGDHASAAVLLAGASPRLRGSDPDLNAANAYAPTSPAFLPLASSAMESAHPGLETPKKPRYGIIVAVVAVLSFVIPLVLYVSLRGNARPPAPRAPATVATDPVGTNDVARGRTPPKPLATPAITIRPPPWRRH